MASTHKVRGKSGFSPIFALKYLKRLTSLPLIYLYGRVKTLRWHSMLPNVSLSEGSNQ